MNRGAGHQSGCGSAVRRNATRRGSVACAGAGWKLTTSVHTTAARGVHRSRSSAEVERRGQGAVVAEIVARGGSVCSVARRHGLSPRQLFGSRRQLRKRSFRSGRSTVRAGVSIGVQILDAE
ncbi:transposase [Bradyrhizobium sp. URHC0002]